jgi:nucleoid DNA-binding protein
MPTITKRELVMRITDQLGEKGASFTQKDVQDIVQTLIQEITDSLTQGHTVVLRNFGAFQVKETAAKIGRNPKQPGSKVVIPARASVKFKPGKELKEKVASILQLIREQQAKEAC